MNSFKTPGFAGIFRKTLNEGWNSPENINGKGSPNGQPHGVQDASGIGDHTIKPTPNPNGTGAPEGYPHGKGSGAMPDKRAKEDNPDGKGSPNGQPHGVQPYQTPDGAPQGDQKHTPAAGDDNKKYADKTGKVNEAVEAINQILAGLNESQQNEVKNALGK